MKTEYINTLPSVVAFPAIKVLSGHNVSNFSIVLGEEDQPPHYCEQSTILLQDSDPMETSGRCYFKQGDVVGECEHFKCVSYGDVLCDDADHIKGFI